MEVLPPGAGRRRRPGQGRRRLSGQDARADKTEAVIDDSSTYGEGLANVLRSTLKTNGGKDVLDDHIDPNGADYGSTVNKIVAAKPAAVFFGGYYDAAGRLVNQLRSAGYKGVFMSGDGSEDPHFITDAGGAPAAGAYLSCACADATKQPLGPDLRLGLPGRLRHAS